MLFSRTGSCNACTCISIFTILAYSAAQQACIVSSPQSVNVSSGDHAVFNCIAIATFINWEINGGPIDSDLINKGFETQLTIDLNVSQDLRMASLRVLGSSENDNTSITCVVVLQLASLVFLGNRSDPALLLVQGLLEPVSNLTVVPINSTTVLISWSPPFTLEGVPILSYNVTITNTTSGENETMSVEEDTTMLYYSIDHPDPDNNFTVTVAPINVVGPGEDVTTFFFFVIIVYSTMPATPVLTSVANVDIFESRNFLQPLSSTTVFEQPSPIVPSVAIIPDSSDNLTIPALISVNVVTVVTILAAIMCCYILRKYIKTRAKGPVQDVVTVSDNPAYQMVIIQRINRTDVNSQLKETTSIIADQSTVTSPQYENIAGVDIRHMNNNSGDEGDYENVE